jgi:hypothetical protein
MVYPFGPTIKMATGTTGTSLNSMSAPLYNVPPLLSSNVGGSNPPSLTRLYRNGTSQGVFVYTFASDTTEREVYLSIQLPHSYMEGTDLHPHLHITVTSTTATGTTMWGMEYTMSNIMSFFPTTTTIISGTLAITGANANQHLIVPFPIISGSGVKISNVMIVRLFRYASNNGDTYPATIYALEFDIHHQNDTAGSRMEYVK